ncbi:MAG: hypothetical protein H0T89_07965 [Deltaproteobacteria bacterium]|nr:hypothetical protein [Deltaproteobacteria bacterium]
MSRRVILGFVVLAACGGDDSGSATAAECNPFGTSGCVLPWPSSVYEREDTTSPTGVRLDLPLGALPVNFDGIEIDPAWMNKRTGFSPMSQILLTFPDGVDNSNLAFYDDIGASLTDASPTVIVNMTTGERVAHFAEVDVNEIDKPEEQVLYLRPAVRLEGGTRYAVGIRKSLHGKTGAELPSTPAFRAIRDGDSSGHARIDAVRGRFPEVFAALATAGVPQDDLVVAFNFMTSDDASLIADPLAARDAAMAVVGNADSVTYAITSDMVNPEAGIARVVRLTYQTPQIADLTGVAGFHRDAAGKVTVMGSTTASASIVIPSCATPSNKAGVVIYGHGFFGGLDEPTGAYARHFAKTTCSVVVGGVWRGMSADDVADALLALNDLNKMPGFGERIWQGMVDFMTLTKLATGKLAREVLVDDPTTPEPIVDPARLLYYGISQGHILGSTLFAYDPTMRRAVLGVGGANWALIFERSNNWAAYSLPLKGAYGGVMGSVILQQVVEMGLELLDGATAIPHLRAGGLPGTPPKQILQQMSMGDCAVPNLASEYQARSLGLPLLGPTVKTPYGFTPTEGPLASGFVIMNESPALLPPVSNEVFNYDNEAHENLRARAATIQQIARFAETGEIVNFCTGACDCKAGNCGALP